MRARSKLLILLNLCIGSLSLFCYGAVADLERIKYVNLTKPELVLEYVKSASKESKDMAKEMYEYAVRGTHRLKVGASWGSVSKSCGESLLLYPMGKTYLLGVEAKLRNWNEAKKENPDIQNQKSRLSRQALERAYGWLNSAVAVESYERSMPDDQRAKLVPYRDCVKRYLDTGNAEPSCVPLQWSGDVPVP